MKPSVFKFSNVTCSNFQVGILNFSTVGLLLDNCWACVGQLFDKLWTAVGQPLDTCWATFGQDCWISVGQRLDNVGQLLGDPSDGLVGYLEANQNTILTQIHT